jgi:tetratricopeptide (TPR) repeat protein/tRNA A-37 threonylcarbamoyl transferase component Bud32
MADDRRDLDSLFLSALEIESLEQRAAFVSRSCGDDVSLRQELEHMLASHQVAGSFLEQPAPELEVTVLPGGDLAAALEAGLAPAFSEGEAVVVGGANHSVLKSLGNTVTEVPKVVLRESAAEGDDPIVRPTSPEIPGGDSDSRYRIDGEIARGGMGAILKGRDTDLGRDLAIKVLLDSHRNKPEVIQRFVEEAQIGGQLQHPGIAPVYELGQFADQRPFFSMKLVKGQTLSSLLADRDDPAQDRGRFLGIFEHVCQTMAYAHSRGVIHRDLKPSNIMVGAFGEVQVMDWGLAKVLPAGGVADEKTALKKQQAQSVIQTRRSVGSDAPGSLGSVGSETQMGSVMGTPAYMAPEQALGEIDQLGQRSDVFGLGAILCEILTGSPPYVADDATQVFRMASRGKLDDCYERLANCGADADLIAVTRQCLEVEPGDRPKDAGVLSEQISGYLESVETKLRETELERAGATARAEAETARAEAETVRAEAETTRAEEERKRRRLTLALAASVLIMLVVGGGQWLSMKRQEANAEAEIHAAVADAEGHQRNAINAANGDERDVDLQHRELLLGIHRLEEVEGFLDAKGVALLSKLHKLAAVAEKEIKLRDDLDEVRLTHEVRLADDVVTFAGTGKLAIDSFKDKHSAARRYAKLLGGWLLETNEQAAQRIRDSAIQESLIAALDDWRLCLPNDTREQDSENGGFHSRLLAIANTADDSIWRQGLRNALHDDDITRVDELMDNEEEMGQQLPALIVWLGRALRDANELQNSINVLRAGQQKEPGDFWLNFELAASLYEQSENIEEAISYGRAALASNPESIAGHLSLVRILGEAKQLDEAILLARKAVELNPTCAEAHRLLGVFLQRYGDLDEAVEVFKTAIDMAIKSDENPSTARIGLSITLCAKGERGAAIVELKKAVAVDPKHKYALTILGLYQGLNGDLADAKVSFDSAIALDPRDARIHYEIGRSYLFRGEHGDAMVEFRKAIAIDPEYVSAYVNLAATQRLQGKPDEAMVEFQKAIAIDPENAMVFNALGYTLRLQGKLDEAIVAYRKAIAIDRKNAYLYVKLGDILTMQRKLDEAVVEYQKAIAINPEYVSAYVDLATTLRLQGKLDEAVDAINEAIKLALESARAITILGLIQIAQGDVSVAIEEFGKLDHDSVLFHSVMAWALVAAPGKDGETYDKALEHMKTARDKIKNTGASVSYYHLNTLGLALYRTNKWEEARVELQESERLLGEKTSDINHPTNLLFLAMCHHQLNEPDEADDWYQKALSWRTEYNQVKEPLLMRFYAEAKELLDPDSVDEPTPSTAPQPEANIDSETNSPTESTSEATPEPKTPKPAATEAK